MLTLIAFNLGTGAEEELQECGDTEAELLAFAEKYIPHSPFDILYVNIYMDGVFLSECYLNLKI